MQVETKKLPSRRKTVVIITVVIACVVLLTALATAFTSSPDSLTIQVTYRQPQSSQVVIQKSIVESSTVKDIYKLVTQLPEVPPGAIYNCPAGSQTYYHYDLTFKRSSITVAEMTVDATSCQFMRIDTLVKWNNSLRTTTDSFWNTMRQQTQFDPFSH